MYQNIMILQDVMDQSVVMRRKDKLQIRKLHFTEEIAPTVFHL